MNDTLLRVAIKADQGAGVAFEEILRDSRDTYNAALEHRIGAYKSSKISVTYNDQCSDLTQLRQDPRFAKIAVDIQREPLRRLDRAFKAFFRRCKSGDRPGFPRFRPRDRYTSFAWHVPRLHGSALLVPNLGQVKFKAHWESIGEPKQVVIKRLGKKWIARLVCYVGEAPEKIGVSRAVGIDLGLTDFITLSGGSAVPAPKFINKHAQRIARAQRSLARKLRGSNNRLRAKEIARRAYQRMADARKNFCHHVSKPLVGTYDLIAHEDFKIANMAKGHFAKSIMDAAWGQLLYQLRYKAESAGTYVVAVNPRGTSQRCSNCGEIVKKKLSERTHTCPKCGLVLGRDHNAALNILKLGLGRSPVGLLAEGSV